MIQESAKLVSCSGKHSEYWCYSQIPPRIILGSNVFHLDRVQDVSCWHLIVSGFEILDFRVWYFFQIFGRHFQHNIYFNNWNWFQNQNCWTSRKENKITDLGHCWTRKVPHHYNKLLPVSFTIHFPKCSIFVILVAPTVFYSYMISQIQKALIIYLNGWEI